jgi:Leu/Phe-tRNA-protein transferase
MKKFEIRVFVINADGAVSWMHVARRYVLYFDDIFAADAIARKLSTPNFNYEITEIN